MPDVREERSETGVQPTARRGFLAWLSVVGGAISGVLVGVPLLRAFVTPAIPKPPKDTWIKVADDIALIDIEVPVRVTFVATTQDAWIETRSINSVWLYTADGEHFKAFNSRCTHLGCGYVFDDKAGHFFCPCHRGQFDVKSGAVLAGPPPRPLDELPVQIRESAVYVQYKNFRLGIPERIET
jgi:menaquinol-cytochrome c reductase iron-sulfur subunit